VEKKKDVGELPSCRLEADEPPFVPLPCFLGWAVVPNAFTKENAKGYASKGHDFLESHKLGE